MSSEKRQRQRENRMRAVAEAERAKKRSTVGRKVLRIVLAVVAVLVGLWLWSTFSGGDDESDDVATDAEAAAPAVTTFETNEPTGATSDEATDEAPDATDAVAATTTAAPAADPASCPAEDGSDGPLNQFDAPPPLCIDVETLYAASFDTNMGAFTMVLDPSLDRLSVNNFVVLGRWGAYDGTLFHRIIANFVVQGGDVQLQYGRGGPGYQFTGDFPPADDWYRIGSPAGGHPPRQPTTGTGSAGWRWPTGAIPPPTARSSSSSPATTAQGCRRCTHRSAMSSRAWTS